MSRPKSIFFPQDKVEVKEQEENVLVVKVRRGPRGSVVKVEGEPLIT